MPREQSDNPNAAGPLEMGSSASGGARPAVVLPDEPTRVSTTYGSGNGGASAAPGILRDAEIEGYRLEEELHRGGQGIVYRAIQLRTKRTVALKVLLEGPFAGENARRRFEREIELAASLQHPHIVTILDSGHSRGRYYFAMEYVEGQRLDRYLAQQGPSLQQTIEILAKVAEAVNYAHQRGVIHRDLKPSNILVDAAGVPHVLDFGLAKHTPDVDPEAPTIEMLSTTGQILGTVAYMSPEQTRGGADVDVRSDVYSLGVVFYEAILGQAPYPVTGALGDVLQNIGNVDPTPPRSIRNKSRFGALLNDELETILLKALEKERVRRYQTAGELAADLRRFLSGEPIEAKRASTWYMTRKMLKRHKGVFTLGGLSLVAMLCFLVTFAVLYQRESKARVIAENLKADREAQTREARLRAEGERIARQEAERNANAARAAQLELQRALAQQRIERGTLARERGGLIQARESYWEAFLDQPGPAAHWALRQYYLVWSSGDDGATILFNGHEGPKAVHAERGLAVGPDSASSLAVRDLRTGRLLNWLRTPGPVAAVSIDAGGNIVAAGLGWGRVWSADNPRPLAAFGLPGSSPPVAILLSSDQQRVFVMWPGQLNVGDLRTGELSHPVILDFEISGTPVLAPGRDQIAIPTEGGLLLADLHDDGWKISRAWTAVNSAVKAVKYIGASQLAFLADGVYFTRLENGRPTRWSTPVGAAGWDYFDIQSDGMRVAIGRADGSIAIYERGNQVATWRTTLDRLEAIWYDSQRRALVGLDSSGVATAWVQRGQSESLAIIWDRGPIQSWALSADGSTAAWIDEEGNAAIYAPQHSTRPHQLRAERSFGLLRSFRKPQTDIAISGDGRRVVLRVDDLYRFIEVDPARGVISERSLVHRGESIEQMALDQDGRLLALHTRSVRGDRHWISFHRWETQDQLPTNRRAASFANLPILGARYAFSGSLIRDMGFVPIRSVLLVARSNSELTLLDPAEGAMMPDAAPGQVFDGALPPRPWLVLDSPAQRFAFDRAGARVALVCDDRVVRVLAMDDAHNIARLPVGPGTPAIGFNGAGDSLVIRRAEDRITIHELGGEQIAAFRAAVVADESPLAFWLGTDDRLLINNLGRLFEYRYQEIDALIERNRPYARRRAIQRLVNQESFEASWAAAEALAESDPEGAASEQRAILDVLLRRPGTIINPAWLAALDNDAAGADLLRLGHAAFEGEKFDLAQRLLTRAEAAYNGMLDAESTRRIAECRYLHEEYAAAAELFQRALAAPDTHRSDAPAIMLERTAALVLAGDLDLAKRVAGAIAQPGGAASNALASLSAANIANFLVGLNSESVLAGTIEQLISLGGDSLLYRDDPHFFHGEIARAQGQNNFAAEQYQKCIDLSRDVWPANWARYRLLQLSQRSVGS
jgi:hypothetical protein